MMFKDITDKNEIYNGPSIQPLHTISAQHTWIKRNLLYFTDNGHEYVIYLSGANLVQYDMGENSMTLIPLRNDCTYTSLSFGSSQTNDRLVIVGEKLKPLNYEAEMPNFKFVVSPRVDINLL